MHLSEADRYRRELTLDTPILRKEYTEQYAHIYLNAVEEATRGYATEIAKPPKKIPYGRALLKSVEEKVSYWKKKDHLLVPRGQNTGNKGDGNKGGNQFNQPPPPPPPRGPNAAAASKGGGRKGQKQEGGRASKTANGRYASVTMRAIAKLGLTAGLLTFAARGWHHQEWLAEAIIGCQSTTQPKMGRLRTTD